MCQGRNWKVTREKNPVIILTATVADPDARSAKRTLSSIYRVSALPSEG